MPYSPLPKHCTPVKNLKGKTTGLMMEGSSMYMETAGQKRENLIDEDPLKMEHDSAMEMSPYEMHSKEHLQKVGKDMPLRMDHDGMPMHGPLHEGHKDSAMPMEHKGVSMKYDSPVPAHTPLHEGHDSPAKFTGMSGGSAFYNTGARPATAKEKAEMRKKPAGFNFLPPSKPQKKSSFKQPILDPKSPGYDVARPLYDSNKDGDTIFSDLNQDGTMVGRAIKKLIG